MMRIPNFILIVSMSLVGAKQATGQTGGAPRSHMAIAAPASLAGARAERVYQAIRAGMRETYADSGDPVATAYQDWRRYSVVPYRSAMHGERFVNNYANNLAGAYGAYEKSGPMPPGAVVVKDSFTVTASGNVLTGPFFLMEKKARGFNPPSRDWLYMMIGADGSLVGMTRGVGAKNVQFCAHCHGRMTDDRDSLFFPPPAFRAVRGTDK